MKILHIVHQYIPENVGGTELYTRWLVHELSKNGHENIIFYRRSGDGNSLISRVDDDGTTVWAVASGGVTSIRRFVSVFTQKYISKSFSKVLAQSKPDIVHIQHLMGLPVDLIKQVKKMGIPYVITLHDYWWKCANALLLTEYSNQICSGPKLCVNCSRCALGRSGYSKLWLSIPVLAFLFSYRNILLDRILKSANKLIAPTEFVARWYLDSGLSKDRLVAIPHGLDAPNLPPRRVRKHDEPIRFGYIGGLNKQKGVHVLVEAFRLLDRGAELWIAGDELANQSYSAILRSLASSNVHFLGRLSREEVWEKLNQIDIVVVPALWCETFSFIVSEAFAAGAPVIASRIGPMEERVRDGLDGILVPPGDVNALKNTLQRFIDDPQLLSELQANIRKPMTFAEYTNKIETVYSETLSQRL